MYRSALILVMVVVVALLPATTALADRPSVGVVQTFANIVSQCPFPEGIAIDPRGNVYASSAPHISAGSGPANICVISPSGEVVRTITIAPGPSGVTNLLGELFVPGRGLYVVDLANDAAVSPPAHNGRLLHVDPATGSVTTLATGFAAPNGIAQDRHRHLFVSDSFDGTITRLEPDGSDRVVWSADPLLSPAPEFPFGANGLAFDRAQRFLYVANTSTRRILRAPVLKDGSAGTMEVFADGDTLNAQQGTTDALVRADGIMFDVRGQLYVCANVSGQIQVLAPDGSAIVARYTGTGTDVLDFPASLVFRGRELFISNLSLLDGGVQSKVSVVEVPFPGLSLAP